MASVSSPGQIQFDDILRAEADAINQRRAALGRPVLAVKDCTGADGSVLDAVGLALSGGGMRSAALSLGVLQAFNHHDALRNIDYLSTVSGGGYVGCALTATMTRGEGQFVFGNAPAREADQSAAEIADTPAVGHLRNYSNYLIPAGVRDVLTALAIMVRGLIANFAVLLAIVMLLAAVTIITNPYRSSLGCADIVGFAICDFVPLPNFGFTLVFAILGVSAFFIWAIYRSFLASRSTVEFRTALPAAAAGYLVFLAVVFFLEFQTVTIDGMFTLADFMRQSGQSTLSWLADTLKTFAAVAASTAAVVTFFRQQIGEFLKASNADATLSTRIIAALGKVAFVITGAALPLLIWVLYLYLSYWGIINDLVRGLPLPQAQQSEVVRSNAVPELPRCQWTRPDPEARVDPQGAHTPVWMIQLASWVTANIFCPPFRRIAVWEQTAFPTGSQPLNWVFLSLLYRPMAFLYVGSGLLLILAAMLLRPNANSLHGLYRDRLSKAFLFDPRGPDAASAVKRNEASIDQGRDFPQLNDMLISALSVRHAPYHLINAALNIQGSDYANRRGRNADFFLFSPRHVGSDATGYAATHRFEAAARDLTLAAAMTISGVAASSNIGAASLKPLRPTLALLNIRLGYWLKNPRYAEQGREAGSRNRRAWQSLFLWNEIFGRLYENSNDVYLTDGGQIENLGVYELLKRRCKLIVVVDGEADFNLRFPAFISLQRYARIDLGIRIDMPWDAIRTTTIGWMGLYAGKDDAKLVPADGPHAAIGCIDYGEGRAGHILYIKASLSGDENDYIRDYARRAMRFPHETTGDQFFSEEQFEVYRALGFHIAHGVLSGRDAVCAPGKPCSFHAQDNDVVKAVRASLIPLAAANDTVATAARAAV